MEASLRDPFGVLDSEEENDDDVSVNPRKSCMWKRLIDWFNLKLLGEN